MMMMVLNARQKGSVLRPVFKSYTIQTFRYKPAFKKYRKHLDWLIIKRRMVALSRSFKPFNIKR